MSRRLTIPLVILSFLLAVSPRLLAEEGTTSAPAVESAQTELLPVYVVFHFRSAFDEGVLGRKAAYMFRAKLRRSEQFEVVAQVVLDDELPDFVPALDDEPERLSAIAHARFYARYVMWGEVVRSGSGYDLSVRVAEIEGDEAPVILETTRYAENPRALGFRSRDVVDELTGFDRSAVPVYGKEPYTHEGPNLVVNGDLEEWAGESEDDGPASWERPNGLTTFWEDVGPPHGRALRTDTDVYLSQWELWYPLWKGGAPASEAPERIATVGPKYNTVGGTCGAWYFSDWIPIEADSLYKMSLDIRGAYAKVFVKGYAQFPDQRREVYRAYKACNTRTGGREWEHFERTFHPTRRTPSVQWVRIKVFTYWPAGVRYLDNFSIQKVW